MELQKESEGSVLRIAVSGELDDHSAEEARRFMDEAIRADASINELHLDLSGLSFMDSAGLGVLLGRYRLMAQRRGRIVVTGTNRYAERIIKMSGLYALIEKGE